MTSEKQPDQTYRAVCYFHPEVAFPVREDRLDVLEDKNSHAHRPGSHHVDVLAVDFPPPTEIEGYPNAGYAREFGGLIERELQHMKDRRHRGDDGPASQAVDAP
ncbi:hypothetical protein [Arthrobacter sp. RCC_34]|uniref:hypothetical protein n=1 Tax=Arthrobacter sp. RCC_34 TaxID=3239230 RepID=UPI0035265ECF